MATTKAVSNGNGNGNGRKGLVLSTGLITFIVIHTFGIVWWARGVDKDVQYNQRNIATNDLRIEKLAEWLSAVDVRISKVEKQPPVP